MSGDFMVRKPRISLTSLVADGGSCCGPGGCGPEAADVAGPATAAPLSAEAVRDTVRQGYGAIAREGGGCAPTRAGAPACCSPAVALDPALIGYSSEEARAAPEGANLGLGCGNPQAIAARPRSGERGGLWLLPRGAGRRARGPRGRRRQDARHARARAGQRPQGRFRQHGALPRRDRAPPDRGRVGGRRPLQLRHHPLPARTRHGCSTARALHFVDTSLTHR